MGNGQSVDESAVVTEMQARAAIKATFSSGGIGAKATLGDLVANALVMKPGSLRPKYVWKSRLKSKADNDLKS